MEELRSGFALLPNPDLARLFLNGGISGTELVSFGENIEGLLLLTAGAQAVGNPEEKVGIERVFSLDTSQHFKRTRVVCCFFSFVGFEE